MQWTDEGIVLGVRRHGEANAILELMTREHGRHLGLVRGGASSRQRPVLQPGNRVSATWRARLDEHLGLYVAEGLDARSASFLTVPHALYGMTHLAALCRLLPERDPHLEIHAVLDALLDGLLDLRRAGPNVVRFELQLLAELGFGLDLASCAASGSETELVYVSPKSGRAVSRQAGEPWKDRLLPLPAFLGEPDDQIDVNRQDIDPQDIDPQDIADGFRLTGFFLARYALEPRGLSFADARASFIAAVLRNRRDGQAVA
jgi:DNA repair protein RecO (recombination protein O)